MILRDKFLSSRLEGDADGEETWRMNLDSRAVRLVEELADLRATMLLQTAPWTGIELKNQPWWE